MTRDSDSGKTHQAILRCAEQEFLLKGFVQASLRSIAQAAGVTTGALYRHFDDKEALFEALVQPVCDELISLLNKTEAHYSEHLEEGGLDAMWNSPGDMGHLVSYVYDHFNTFKLLLTSSEQSAYENFTHSLVDHNVNSTLSVLRKARVAGCKVRSVSADELHVIVSAQASCVFEMVIHDMPREKAVSITETVAQFFAAGYRKIITGQ